MSSKISSKIEFVANIAILCVALLFGYFLIQQIFIQKQTSTDPPKQIAKGTKIKVSDIDWSKNEKNLLLVLQKGCKYCTESMPFYKDLVKKASEKGVNLVAILPNSLEESNQYLNEHGVEIKNVRQGSLSSVDVRGTPTLIMVNNKGEVSNSWIGKLPSGKQKEVISQL